MKDLLDKITSYNIFNYLLPGVLFVILAKATTDYNFVQEDIFLGIFLYYFIGMTISRFGSVIIEPLFKKIKFLKFSNYKDYVTASKIDGKIELLSEVNNTYRTLNAMNVSLLLLILYNYLDKKFQLGNSISLIILTLILTVLYVFAYIKQTNYLTKRIDVNKSEEI